MLTLNYIANLPTPPVNQILRCVARRSDVKLRLWYSTPSRPDLYSWKGDLANEIEPAAIYGSRVPSAAVINHVVRNPHEAYLVVGWGNPTTRALVPILSAARRRYAIHTDHPQDHAAFLRNALRDTYIGMMKRSASVLGIGKMAVDYFAQRGFDPRRLRNVPFPVPSPADRGRICRDREGVRSRFGAGPSDLFVVTGSRFVREKGFDLMLRAFAKLPQDERARVRALVVGKGPTRPELDALVRELGLEAQVQIRDWMEFDDFCEALAAADVAIHPARFDPYGGISLTAVGLGVPVIGSRRAGSAVDLVRDGQSGFLYEPEDVDALAGHVRTALREPETLQRMRVEAEAVAATQTPERVAETLVEAIQVMVS
jgi:glycosyltransferase involved in cell wall biosynthesis